MYDHHSPQARHGRGLGMPAKRSWIEFVEAVGVTPDGEVFVPRVTVARDDNEDTESADEVAESGPTDDD